MPDLLAYIYNENTGAVWHVPTSVANLELKFSAWHGPFQTEQEVADYYTANKKPSWKAPTGNVAKILQNAVSTVTTVVTEKAKDAVTPSLDKYGPWFIRIGEVLLGLVLIGIGLAKLTGTTNLIAKTAKAVIP